MKTKCTGLFIALLIAVAVCFAGCTTPSQPQTSTGTTTVPATSVQTTSVQTPSTQTTSVPAQGSILVYAGAGLKAPMDEIGTSFTKKYGIDVQYSYGGSGVLITQMNLTKKGDVFMPGSTTEFGTAKNQGLVNDSRLIAYHVPIIAVQKGNPKNITTIQDFARPGLKIALGDVNATAIGKAGAKMFAKFNITGQVEKNVVTRAPTINELTVAMNTGQVDATILTLDQINPDKVDAIPIPVTDNVVLIVPVGQTTFTKNPENAGKFIDFVSSDEGRAIIEAHGFPLYPDPKYANVKP